MGTSSQGPASLRVIFGIVLLDLLGFGILIPQLGVYGVKFSASPFTVGLLLSVYSLMQLVFAPVLGWLSDRYGRRPVLLYSLGGSLLGYLLFAFARSLPLLFAARIVDGITGGNISTAQAYVADVTTAENRARGMGMIGAAFGLGFILGPALGGLLGAWGGNLAIGLAAAALCGTNLLLTAVRLPESRRPGDPASSGGKSLAGAAGALRQPVVGLALVLSLLFVTAFAQMEGTFSVFLITRHLAQGPVAVSASLFSLAALADNALLREASWRSGVLFTEVGVLSALVQGGLIGRLRARFGEAPLVAAGTALTALGLLTVPLAPAFGWLAAPMALLALGSGLFNPSLSAIVSLRADPERQGQALGAYQAMGSLGRVAGPSIGGLLFSLRAGAAPYYAAAGMTGVCVALALRLSRQLRRAAPTSGQGAGPSLGAA